MLIAVFVSMFAYFSVSLIVFVLLNIAIKGKLGFVLNKEEVTYISILWIHALVFCIIVLPIIGLYVKFLKRRGKWKGTDKS